MTGTFINIAAVLVGSILGLILGARIPARLKETIIAGMGIFLAAMGIQMFLETVNPLIVLGALLIGTLLGEWWRIEDGIHNLGKFLEQRFSAREDDSPNTFVRGFMTASLLFCVGPVAILGSIQDGLTGDYSLLAVKSVLDGFASIAFASTLGIGVAFSSLMLLVYQGAISLMSAQLDAIVTASMMNELTATGGVLLIGIGISNLLEIKKIRAGNMLPALFVAPALVWVLSLF
ncbi:MAG TPA: DUF554 domain-containing protein [Anaerolineales bacterium]|nr:DUF554 domain-containing protein [Anaerolineales bacterium]